MSRPILRDPVFPYMVYTAVPTGSRIKIEVYLHAKVDISLLALFAHPFIFVILRSLKLVNI